MIGEYTLMEFLERFIAHSNADLLAKRVGDTEEAMVNSRVLWKYRCTGEV